MRQERTVQATVFDIFAEHEIGRELNAISQWLDQQRWLLGLIAADLRGHGIKETGRHGLPAEAVLQGLKGMTSLAWTTGDPVALAKAS